MKTPARLGPLFRTVTLAGLALAAVAYGSAQIRQPAGPTPKPKPQTFQTIGNLPDPMRVELGTLKQQVAGLQQGLKALETANTTLQRRLARTEDLLGTVRKSLKDHRHHLGLNFMTKKQFAMSPNQRVACPLWSANDSLWTEEAQIK